MMIFEQTVHKKVFLSILIDFSVITNSGVIFEIYMYAQNIFKSWILVPKPNPENFVKICSSDKEIWGFEAKM